MAKALGSFPIVGTGLHSVAGVGPQREKALVDERPQPGALSIQGTWF